MTADLEVPARSPPAEAHQFVYCSPCIGIVPVVVDDARMFLLGQATAMLTLLGFAALVGLVLLILS